MYTHSGLAAPFKCCRGALCWPLPRISYLASIRPDFQALHSNVLTRDSRISASATSTVLAGRLVVDLSETSTSEPTSSLVRRSPSSSRASRPSTHSWSMRLASTSRWLAVSEFLSFAGSELSATTMPWSWISSAHPSRISSTSATASSP